MDIDEQTMKRMKCEVNGHTVRLKRLELTDATKGLQGVFECTTCGMQFQKIEK